MNKAIGESDFENKFKKLNADNQRYVIAVQQALLFAQATETTARKKMIKKG